MEIKYKSKLNVCLCARPMRLTHTIVHEKGDNPEFPEGGIEVKEYGDTSTHCKYCGKKWENHR